MRYFLARLKQYRRDEAYRFYITDSIYLQSRGKALTERYADIVGRIGKPKDARTGEQVAADVVKNAGLTIRG